MSSSLCLFKLKKSKLPFALPLELLFGLAQRVKTARE